jgi:hypothetical protein
MLRGTPPILLTSSRSFSVSTAGLRTHNKATIEAKFSRQPANLIYKTLILLQQWRILQKAEMVPLLDEAIALLKDIYYNTSSRPAGGA